MSDGWTALQMLLVMGCAVMTVRSARLGARMAWCIALMLNTAGLMGRAMMG